MRKLLLIALAVASSYAYAAGGVDIPTAPAIMTIPASPAPAVAPANTARTYYDLGAQAWKLSTNGGAYVNIGGGGGGAAPFTDASALVKNSGDATKLAIFSAASITTGTTRTYTLPDANTTLVGTSIANTFTVGPQTLRPGNDANVGLVVKENSLSQSANAFNIVQSDGTNMFQFGHYPGAFSFDCLWVGGIAADASNFMLMSSGADTRVNGSNSTSLWVSASQELVVTSTTITNNLPMIQTYEQFNGRTAPPVSGAGTGRVYFDSGSNTFKASQNTGAYSSIVQTGTPNTFTTGVQTIATGADANTGLTIKENSATQTAPLLDLTQSDGTTHRVQIGTFGAGALYALTFGNVTPSTGNYALYGDGASVTVLNSVTGGTTALRVNNTNVLAVTSTAITASQPLTVTANTITTTSTGANAVNFINDNSAGNLAVTVYQSGGTNKWQIGKQTDSSFSIYDSANGRAALAFTGASTTATFGGPISNPTLTGAVITAALTGTGAYIPVSLLNSGTGATSSTFWRGDGTWAAAGGGGALPVNSSGAGTPVIFTSSSTSITGNGNVIAFANTAAATALTSGTNNVIIGNGASGTLINGIINVVIGNSADVGASDAQQCVVIGSSCVAPNNGVVIGNGAGHAGTTAGSFVAVGTTAGTSISSGADNTFIGNTSGTLCTTGASNTFVGSHAGQITTGSSNTCIGKYSGKAVLTTGSNNTLLGTGSDVGASGAASSVAIGFGAITPTGGTVIGNAAGKASATAARFTCVGNTAGAGIVSGADNVFVGDQCAKAQSTGSQNVYIGSAVKTTSTADSNEVVIGYMAGNTSVNGADAGVVFIGFQCGQVNTGANNTFVGYSCGQSNTSGQSNTFVGENSGILNIAGQRNSFFGRSSGAGVNGSGDNDNTFFGYLAGLTAKGSASGGNTIIGSGADVNGATDISASVFGFGSKGASSSVIFGVSKTSSTANDFIIESGDVGFRRVAAKVMKPTDGAGVGAWLQQTAGSVVLAANYTNATATFSNTALSVTLVSGRKYAFHCVLIYANSTAAEGAQFDFAGGAATSTNFVAGSEGGINDTVTTTLAGTFTQSTVTSNNITTIDGTFEPSSSSTFIVRGAEVSHSTGTLTVLRGSYLRVWDMP